MKNRYKYLILLFLCFIVCFLTFVKSPEELSLSMYKIAADTKLIAAIMHGIFFICFIIGLVLKKTRKVLFTFLMLLLSGTAFVISFMNKIIPNVVLFGTIFILTISAIIKKELDFDVSKIGTFGKLVGFISITAGFYYLHWVDIPIWKNALYYSPLGIINCPTLVCLCGLLVFIKKPGSIFLELFVGFMTLYFGFFGIMRLGAKIDIILIASSIYLLSRQVSKLDINSFYRQINVVR